MFEIILCLPDGRVATRSLSSRPLTVGRDPGCDLVVDDATVSANHAVVWIEGGGPWVMDLDSSNGTWVGGKRVSGSQPVRPDTLIRIGMRVSLSLMRVEPPAANRGRAWEVVDLATSARHGVVSDRFYVGSRPHVHVHVPDAPPVGAVVLVHDDGEAWLGRGTHEAPVADGDTFEVAGRTFRVEAVSGGGATWVPHPARYPYVLDVHLGVDEAFSSVEGPEGARWFSGELAVAGLLYTLGHAAAGARRARADGAAGWVPFEHAAVRLWGTPDEDRLFALLLRIRSGVEAAGLEPWFLERRRDALRVRAGQISVRRT
ncbi:MAG: FHA domain-containing protein [Myxococcota bacterium]